MSRYPSLVWSRFAKPVPERARGFKSHPRRSFYLFFDIAGFMAYKPVAYVDENISIKGIHVPRMLVNISKLFWIKRATTNISMKMTSPVKRNAVSNGVA